MINKSQNEVVAIYLTTFEAHKNIFFIFKVKNLFFIK